MNLNDLKKPFPYEDIEWRAGATNADKTKALALAYITSRAVMDRLDEVCGPEHWHNAFLPGPSGGVICGISIKIPQTEWITKWDGADNSDIESVKGGLSDAFKRAGVQWGIGRYLYNLDSVWVKCEQRGKSVVLIEKPKLPAWALPAGYTPPAAQPAPRAVTPPPTNHTGPVVESPAKATAEDDAELAAAMDIRIGKRFLREYSDDELMVLTENPNAAAIIKRGAGLIITSRFNRTS